MYNLKLKINPIFVANALRNCGYTNYSAIADIVDNSLEPEVESTFVKVDFDTEGTGASDTTVKAIYIIDDGNGMDAEILEEAMSLGSRTGKNGVENLGMYGAGLKTASFSIGRVLDVFTKTLDGQLHHAEMSIENVLEDENSDIEIAYNDYPSDSEEYAWFLNTVGKNHGTIVKISSLDRLANKNYYSFKGTLRSKLGEYFNKFIFADVVKFYVGKDKVPYVELMGNVLQNDIMGEGSFEVDGHKVSYRAWYMPQIGGDTENETESHLKLDDGTEYTSRTGNNQGLYFYRNNRLVGKGLTLGLWPRHSLKNGFRCEIFVDGNCDHLFGSTFTKMIGESAKGSLNQSLYDKLCSEIVPFAKQADRREKKDANERKKNNPEEQKATEEFYKRVTEKQNSNMMLKANRKGENKPKTDEEKEEDKEHKERGKQKNPNPIRTRTNKWLDGFEERPMGRTGEMYCMERTNRKRIILINTDHPFYQKFYSRLDNDLKFTMAQIISCQEIAKQNVNYYSEDYVRDIIDAYNVFESGEVSKSLSF